jgi:hypothetical protein
MSIFQNTVTLPVAAEMEVNYSVQTTTICIQSSRFQKFLEYSHSIKNLYKKNERVEGRVSYLSSVKFQREIRSDPSYNALNLNLTLYFLLLLSQRLFRGGDIVRLQVVYPLLFVLWSYSLFLDAFFERLHCRQGWQSEFEFELEFD